jgi:GNAT superfamily N-acetyltransferase
MTRLALEFDYVTSRRSFDEMAELAYSTYAGRPRRTALDREMWRAFPQGYVAVWINDHIRGCIQLWPLDGRRAASFLIGARTERSLTVDDLATVCNSSRTVWYFSSMIVDPAWRGRGLGAHLMAEAMGRWQRDLPWQPPVQFAALATNPDARGFIRGFGMMPARPGDESADGFTMFTRTFERESELLEVVRTARQAADRKGPLVLDAP